MIVLVCITIVIWILYVLFSFVKLNSKDSINPNANLEKTPEEMPIPIYRPFKDGPFHVTMGLQSLNPDEWIQIDPYYREQIKLKQNLLSSSRRSDLFIYNDEAYAGSMETLKMLIEYLPRQYPNMFQANHSKTKILNLITNQTYDLTEPNHLHPLEIASYLVQEDLVIMQRKSDGDAYHANALSVCFPSGWVAKSKFTLPLSSIHIPHVPFFQEKLRASTDRYFLKLQEDKPVQRVNWTLQIGNELCQINMEEDDVGLITKDNAGKVMYLRCERQTLRRLPISKTILFTIKTYTTQIEDVCRNNPDISKRLASAVRNWPPEVIAYKAADRYKEGLLDYLDMMSNLFE